MYSAKYLARPLPSVNWIYLRVNDKFIGLVASLEPDSRVEHVLLNFFFVDTLKIANDEKCSCFDIKVLILWENKCLRL